VAAFTVSIVREHVKHCHALQVTAMTLPQSLVLPVGARAGLDIELQAADTVRPFFSDDGWRDHLPAQVPRESVGGDFALVQRAIGEVAQWNLATARLVHAVAARPVFTDHERCERVIGPPRDQLNSFDYSAFEERKWVLGERCSL